jgi:hypothetical protein
MRFTNIFPNPVDGIILMFTIDSNPEKHKGYSEHIKMHEKFDSRIHQQLFEGKWNLKDGEIVIHFLHIKGQRTKTMVCYQEANFTCKIDDWDSANEGDYHIEVDGIRDEKEKHIPLDKNLHPALFCLFVLLDKLVKIKDHRIPIYFFFEEQIKRNPEVVDIILKNKPSNVSIVWYCYAISFKLWYGNPSMNLKSMNEWMDKFQNAIKWFNERHQKNEFIKIPWGNEQRIFPIPITGLGGDVVYLDYLGTREPKLPDFLSSVPFRFKSSQVRPS